MVPAVPNSDLGVFFIVEFYLVRSFLTFNYTEFGTIRNSAGRNIIPTFNSIEFEGIKNSDGNSNFVV
jgi:hypothetical protein